MQKFLGRAKRAFTIGLLTAVLAGCASTGPRNPRDPLEPINRAVFNFNDNLDTYVLKPVAEGYRFVVPSIVRAGFSNFFSNLGDVWIGTNNLLQGKVEAGLGDWMRFAINSTFGLGGILDIASEAQLQKHNEDFGQTLGWWGVGSGPYLVLPFFGPSTLRDTAALPVDLNVGNLPRTAFIDAVVSERAEVALRNSLWGLSVVNLRADLLDASNLLEQASLDRYRFMRDAFMQRRRSLVYDGNPPKVKDDDDDALAPMIDPSPAWAVVPAPKQPLELIPPIVIAPPAIDVKDVDSVAAVVLEQSAAEPPLRSVVEIQDEVQKEQK